MRDMVRGVTALMLLTTLAACGGGASEEPPAPPSASSELASLHRSGELDPTRLACAMVALPQLEETMGPVLLALADPGPVRYRAGSSHGRAVQAGMASSEYRNGAMRVAASARQAATQAALRGRAYDAARWSTYANQMMRNAQRSPPVGGATAYRFNRDPDQPTAQELLREYAWLQATLASIDAEGDDGRSEELQVRIGEIATGAPQVAETYADLLLYVYRDTTLDCTPLEPVG